MAKLNNTLSSYANNPNSFINLNPEHISSVGDPWIQYAQSKKDKTLKLPKGEFNPYAYGKQTENK